MIFTVGEMAKLLGVPPSTLRYYDKEGLLPFVERSSGGIRMFQEKDYEWLQIIEALKKTGMSLKNIRVYIELAMRGDETIDERLKLIRAHRETVAAQMEELAKMMETINYKCWYYEEAQKVGTTRGLRDMPLEEIPEAYRETRCRLRQLPEDKQRR